ncbi:MULTISPECIES: YihY/virulence factor BrkB family protein [unclassified Knoellia]|uniref:YihY/virulence factor BrkB family protein n=1 Tax=Knoellia altitudinis TaxID=3404795 RepID=UPI00360BD20B
MNGAKRRLRGWLARFPALETLARLTVETIRICLRYRVTGLASEAGFFALLSLPPLVLGLFGGVGYVGRWLGQDTVQQVRLAIAEYAGRFLTEDIISRTLSPTVDDVFQDGRFDLISVGFVLSLWSGSRALNVLVDTVSIMYGQSGVRGIVPTRALSFSLYVVALLVGVVTIPLVLIGPTLLGEFLPDAWDFLTFLYWPVVSLLVIATFTSLYHVSTPLRSPWTRDIPGAVLTLLIWVVASFAVRGTIAASLGGASIYGPLSAPIVLLIWLYMLAIAVLIGAALNAAIRNLWPAGDDRGLRERLAALVLPGRGAAAAERAAGPGEGREPGGALGGDERRNVEDAEEGADQGADKGTDDDLDLNGIRDAARRPLTPINDDETLVIPRIRVGSGR